MLKLNLAAHSRRHVDASMRHVFRSIVRLFSCIEACAFELRAVLGWRSSVGRASDL
jgi:hypothetical protein